MQLCRIVVHLLQKLCDVSGTYDGIPMETYTFPSFLGVLKAYNTIIFPWVVGGPLGPILFEYHLSVCEIRNVVTLFTNPLPLGFLEPTLKNMRFD